MWQQKLRSRPNHRHRFLLMGLGTRTQWLLPLVVLLLHPIRWPMAAWVLLPQCKSSSVPSLHRRHPRGHRVVFAKP